MTHCPTTTIRPATPADGEAIVDVHVASIRELGPDAYDPEQVDAWAANKRPDRYPLESDSTYAVVAETDDEGDGEREGDERDDRGSRSIVGFGWVDLESGEVTAVYVHPDHTRHGVGRAILDHLEHRARETGLETLTLTASLNAVPFYERQGYQSIECIEHESSGETLECVRMRRDLGDELDLERSK